MPSFLSFFSNNRPTTRQLSDRARADIIDRQAAAKAAQKAGGRNNQRVRAYREVAAAEEAHHRDAARRNDDNLYVNGARVLRARLDSDTYIGFGDMTNILRTYGFLPNIVGGEIWTSQAV